MAKKDKAAPEAVEINDDAVLFHRQFCAAMDSLADPDGGK